MNRQDFQALATIRIAEAEELFKLSTPMPNGAYYLAGYAVECALKACIAKGFVAGEWPEKQFVIDCYCHDISKLVRLAKLNALLDADINANANLGTNWLITKDWTERSRYEQHTITKTQKLIAAIRDPKDGVLAWLQGHW